MKKFHPLLLSAASCLLLWLSWPPLPTTFLVFMAFVPLFYLLEQGPKRGAFLGWCYLSMLGWNVLTTWWIWNSTDVGAVSAILANSLFMTLPWLALFNVRKRLGAKMGYWAFLACWISFEYVHLNWELSWPWLTLGNVFADRPSWVQWYQFTGTTGGSIWILFINITLLQQINAVGRNNRLILRSFAWFMAAAIGVPIAISFMVKAYNLRLHADDSIYTKNIVIVQPNIDPYAKFAQGTQQQQLHKLIQLSQNAIDSNTVLVVWPETAINSPSGIEEDKLKQDPSLHSIWSFLTAHPNIKLLAGIESYGILAPGSTSPYARKISGTNLSYEAYNTAALLDSSGILFRYHKSKLVPGVETLPSFLKFMDSWFEQFGGTTGGYAKQDDRTVLEDEESGLMIAPAICYESIYGEFMTGFIRNGANMIAIITNDGWWGNTAGHKQHLAYAKLRAIETRRWVVRSANTGISAVIDPYGNLVEKKAWDTAAVMRTVIQPNLDQTLFVRYGDWLSKIMLILAFILLGYSTFRYGRARNEK